MPATALQMAREFHSAGRHGDARQILSKLVQDDSTPNEELAAAQALLIETTDAENLTPTAASQTLLQARRLLEGGQTDAALDMLERAQTARALPTPREEAAIRQLMVQASMLRGQGQPADAPAAGPLASSAASSTPPGSDKQTLQLMLQRARSALKEGHPDFACKVLNDMRRFKDTISEEQVVQADLLRERAEELMRSTAGRGGTCLFLAQMNFEAGEFEAAGQYIETGLQEPDAEEDEVAQLQGLRAEIEWTKANSPPTATAVIERAHSTLRGGGLRAALNVLKLLDRVQETEPPMVASEDEGATLKSIRQQVHEMVQQSNDATIKNMRDALRDGLPEKAIQSLREGSIDGGIMAPRPEQRQELHQLQKQAVSMIRIARNEPAMQDLLSKMQHSMATGKIEGALAAIQTADSAQIMGDEADMQAFVELKAKATDILETHNDATITRMQEALKSGKPEDALEAYENGRVNGHMAAHEAQQRQLNGLKQQAEDDMQVRNTPAQLRLIARMEAALKNDRPQEAAVALNVCMTQGLLEHGSPENLAAISALAQRAGVTTEKPDAAQVLLSQMRTALEERRPEDVKQLLADATRNKELRVAPQEQIELHELQKQAAEQLGTYNPELVKQFLDDAEAEIGNGNPEKAVDLLMKLYKNDSVDMGADLEDYKRFQALHQHATNAVRQRCDDNIMLMRAAMEHGAPKDVLEYSSRLPIALMDAEQTKTVSELRQQAQELSDGQMRTFASLLAQNSAAEPAWPPPAPPGAGQAEVGHMLDTARQSIEDGQYSVAMKIAVSIGTDAGAEQRAQACDLFHEATRLSTSMLAMSDESSTQTAQTLSLLRQDGQANLAENGGSDSLAMRTLRQAAFCFEEMRLGDALEKIVAFDDPQFELTEQEDEDLRELREALLQEKERQDRMLPKYAGSDSSGPPDVTVLLSACSETLNGKISHESMLEARSILFCVRECCPTPTNDEEEEMRFLFKRTQHVQIAVSAKEQLDQLQEHLHRQKFQEAVALVNKVTVADEARKWPEQLKNSFDIQCRDLKQIEQRQQLLRDEYGDDKSTSVKQLLMSCSAKLANLDGMNRAADRTVLANVEATLMWIRGHCSEEPTADEEKEMQQLYRKFVQKWNASVDRARAPSDEEGWGASGSDTDAFSTQMLGECERLIAQDNLDRADTCLEEIRRTNQLENSFCIQEMAAHLMRVRSLKASGTDGVLARLLGRAEWHEQMYRNDPISAMESFGKVEQKLLCSEADADQLLPLMEIIERLDKSLRLDFEMNNDSATALLALCRRIIDGQGAEEAQRLLERGMYDSRYRGHHKMAMRKLVREARAKTNSSSSARMFELESSDSEEEDGFDTEGKSLEEIIQTAEQMLDEGRKSEGMRWQRAALKSKEFLTCSDVLRKRGTDLMMKAFDEKNKPGRGGDNTKAGRRQEKKHEPYAYIQHCRSYIQGGRSEVVMHFLLDPDSIPCTPALSKRNRAELQQLLKLSKRMEVVKDQHAERVMQISLEHANKEMKGQDFRDAWKWAQNGLNWSTHAPKSRKTVMGKVDLQKVRDAADDMEKDQSDAKVQQAIDTARRLLDRGKSSKEVMNALRHVYGATPEKDGFQPTTHEATEIDGILKLAKSQDKGMKKDSDEEKDSTAQKAIKDALRLMASQNFKQAASRIERELKRKGGKKDSKAMKEKLELRQLLSEVKGELAKQKESAMSPHQLLVQDCRALVAEDTPASLADAKSRLESALAQTTPNAEDKALLESMAKEVAQSMDCAENYGSQFSEGNTDIQRYEAEEQRKAEAGAAQKASQKAKKRLRQKAAKSKQAQAASLKAEATRKSEEAAAKAAAEAEEKAASLLLEAVHSTIEAPAEPAGGADGNVGADGKPLSKGQLKAQRKRRAAEAEAKRLAEQEAKVREQRMEVRAEERQREQHRLDEEDALQQMGADAVNESKQSYSDQQKKDKDLQAALQASEQVQQPSMLDADAEPFGMGDEDVADDEDVAAVLQQQQDDSFEAFEDMVGRKTGVVVEFNPSTRSGFVLCEKDVGGGDEEEKKLYVCMDFFRQYGGIMMQAGMIAVGTRLNFDVGENFYSEESELAAIDIVIMEGEAGEGANGNPNDMSHSDSNSDVGSDNMPEMDWNDEGDAGGGGLEVTPSSWDMQDVLAWCQDTFTCYDQYSSVIEIAGLDGAALLECDDSFLLVKLKVVKVSHRKAMTTEINKLRALEGMEPLVQPPMPTPGPSNQHAGQREGGGKGKNKGGKGRKKGGR